MLICLLMNASQSSWQFCLILDTAILTWIELLFQAKKRRNRDKAWGRGEDLGPSLESLGQKKGFLRGGKGHSVLLDWTEVSPAGAAAFLPAPSLHNYTPDETHYEMFPNLTRYSCHRVIYLYKFFPMHYQLFHPSFKVSPVFLICSGL